METLLPLLFVGCMLVGVYFVVSKIIAKKKNKVVPTGDPYPPRDEPKTPSEWNTRR
jgi:hypothetical protein